MNLGKIKTFLIILFLGIDIYLVFSVLASSVFRIDDATVNNTVQILRQSDISVDKSIIPTKTENLKNIETQNVIYSKDFKSGQYFDKCTVTGDTFELNLDVRNLQMNNDKEFKKYAKKVLYELGIDTSFVKFSDIKTNGAKHMLKAMCCVRKYRIFDSQISFVLQNGKIFVSGSWYEPLSKEVKSNSKSREIVYSTGVLVNLVSNDTIIKSAPVSITSVDLGYMSGSLYGGDGHVTATAIPYYKIVDSNKNVYYYDATDGSYLNKK